MYSASGTGTIIVGSAGVCSNATLLAHDAFRNAAVLVRSYDYTKTPFYSIVDQEMSLMQVRKVAVAGHHPPLLLMHALNRPLQCRCTGLQPMAAAQGACLYQSSQISMKQGWGLLMFVL